MNFKLKSLVYLIAFVFSALVYYQMDRTESENEKSQLPELTLEDSAEQPSEAEPVL